VGSAGARRAVFDAPARIRQHAPGSYDMAVTRHAMPLGNETAITDAERARIGAWLKAGAPIPQVFTVSLKKIF
jgi:uncharacterized membrane protein